MITRLCSIHDSQIEKSIHPHIIEKLAKIMTLESGKPLQESLGEISYGASFLDFYAAEAIRSDCAGGGKILPSPFSSIDGSPRGKIFATKEAVGICAMITPWNFPLAMITRKVGPALAAGCTTIVKPSEYTPLTAIAAHNLAVRAGVPDGVFELMYVHKVSFFLSSHTRKMLNVSLFIF
jgi:acyl-CoA reductase-like NAD-dependent aldehyde dehydrogenase